jgi:hypothetical protein
MTKIAMTKFRFMLSCIAMPAMILGLNGVNAQSFSALISPPRFEVNVKPGETSRHVFEVSHTGNQTGRYKIYTSDWLFAADASVTFSEEVKPDSCRPWVAIERRELVVSPNNTVRYRFEIKPPADAQPVECRFAIMVEGQEQSVQTQGALTFPVSGRVAVIVYATLGGAAPKLEVAETKVLETEGKKLPALMMRNTGNAHGRMTGFLTGTDAAGRKLEFTPSTLPILPGETRTIVLNPNVEGKTGYEDVSYPVTISGMLEWGNAASNSTTKQPFEQRFAP